MRTIIMNSTWSGDGKIECSRCCAPTKELSVYRDGLDDYEDSVFFFDCFDIEDENITVEQVVKMTTFASRFQARSLTVSKPQGGKEVIWDNLEGFYWDKDAVFYWAMDKLRNGDPYASELVGKYVFIATFDKPE